MRLKSFLLTCLWLSAVLSFAQKKVQPAFQVVPLGVKGGIDESNLSAYLLAPYNTTNYICLDGGTVYAGIEKAIKKKAFRVPAERVLRSYIKAYFVSHPHLDHVSGLLMNATDDSVKSIYGLPGSLDVLKQHYFNWKSWPNFTDEGSGFKLNQYHYRPLTPMGAEIEVERTGGMMVKAFPLSHGAGYESAAFLIRQGDSYVVYLGDTGPDEVEKSTKLQELWQQLAPFIKDKKLKGIFIEVSYPNEQPDNKLFGHLTPNWLMQELHKLSLLTGPESMRDLKVVITHIKPTGKNEKIIKEQLKELNTLHLNLIFPEQGNRFAL